VPNGRVGERRSVRGCRNPTRSRAGCCTGRPAVATLRSSFAWMQQYSVPEPCDIQGTPKAPALRGSSSQPSSLLLVSMKAGRLSTPCVRSLTPQVRKLPAAQTLLSGTRTRQDRSCPPRTLTRWSALCLGRLGRAGATARAFTYAVRYGGPTSFRRLRRLPVCRPSSHSQGWQRDRCPAEVPQPLAKRHSDRSRPSQPRFVIGHKPSISGRRWHAPDPPWRPSLCERAGADTR